jgi:hypothetical protein
MHMMLYVCTLVVGGAVQAPCSGGVVVEEPFGPNGVTYDKGRLEATSAAERAKYPNSEIYITIRACGLEMQCARP